MDKRGKEITLLVIGIIVGCLLACYIEIDKTKYVTREHTVVKHDTVTVKTPVPYAEKKLGIRKIPNPKTEIESPKCDTSGQEHHLHREDDNTDQEIYTSTEVTVLQRHYQDSTYQAWVSGPIDPRLDSIKVYNTTREITHDVLIKDNRRWHLGLTAGYGYGPKGFQPYIGVGITYSFLSW